MIKLTKINGAEYYVNPDMIEYIEVANETMVCLQNGKHLNVREEPETVIDRIIEYKTKNFVNVHKVIDNSHRILVD